VRTVGQLSFHDFPVLVVAKVAKTNESLTDSDRQSWLQPLRLSCAPGAKGETDKRKLALRTVGFRGNSIWMWLQVGQARSPRCCLGQTGQIGSEIESW
jgi:hypothetical protein